MIVEGKGGRGKGKEMIVKGKEGRGGGRDKGREEGLHLLGLSRKPRPAVRTEE